MEVTFKTKKLRRECTELKVTNRVYGNLMAEKIRQRIREINGASTVEMLVEGSIGRCHPLKGERAGEYAMDLVHPYRLVFQKVQDTVQIAQITSIEDYH